MAIGTRKKAEAGIAALLQFIGENPSRPGLLETPARVVKGWAEWTSGYATEIEPLFKTFKDDLEDGGVERYDQMVVVRNIDVYSQCEHHMAPFMGSAHIAYIPNQRVVGLSKLARVVDAFSRRLQVQERLTMQIADAIEKHLEPIGVGVVIEAKHMCMCSRGVRHTRTDTVTSALRGALKDEGSARAEFYSLVRRVL